MTSWDLDSAINPAHLREWVEGSGVDPVIAARNIVSMDGEAVIDTLCGDRLEAAGGHGQQYATRPVANLLNRYEQAAEGGWWCSPLITNNGWVTSSAWGCFKPDSPRLNEEGKAIKYEHPLDQQCGVFWLRNKQDNFWPWVLGKPGSLTIVITEGAKKAAALLTAGIPAVAVSGIWNGTPLVEPKGDPKGVRRLHPDLLPLAKHRIVIAFDFSKSNKGKAAVKSAAHRLAHYLYANGCPWVGSATCPGPEHKGVDDVLVHEGADELHRLISQAAFIDLPKEHEESTKARDLELAAAAFLDSDRPAERASIRSQTCSKKCISRSDFMELVSAEMERRNPVLQLASASLSLDEIAAQPVEKPKALIHQLLHERHSTLIGGRKGSTKSILVTRSLIGLCSDTPGEVVGLQCEASNKRALYICSDMRSERILTYLDTMGVAEDAAIRRNLRVWGLSKTTRGWDIRDTDGLQRELDDHQPDVVVIDSLKAAMGPLLDEISKPIVRHYMDAVHAIVLQSAACAWIHHANKNGEIADNEGITECPDMVYHLSKDENNNCKLKPVKCRLGAGIAANYTLHEDFLDLVLLEPRAKADMGKVLLDCIDYVRVQNKAGLKPSLGTIAAGLAPKGHSPEAIKSSMRRNTGCDAVFRKERNPKDLREALFSLREK